jgi:hypothetical protein
MTSGEFYASEINPSEEFLVLEEGNEVGSPFRKEHIRAGGVHNMEKGRIHRSNIRKDR